MEKAATPDKQFKAGNGPAANEFQDIYLAVRDLEKRLYTDEEVRRLPDVSSNHIHRREWKVRKQSAGRLISYLVKKARPLNILEVGCGNGWLSHRLSSIKQTEVTGLDVNLPELSQGARIFAHQENLHFVYGDVRKGVLGAEKYDVIVFAASIQYFESFSEIIHTALQLLSTAGEIHLMDTIFYKQEEIEGARQRSKEYFRRLGYDTMADRYFHLSLAQLHEFKSRILYDPNEVWHRLLKRNNPFYWVRIKG